MRLPPPDPARPRSFRRYLAHAQRRHRRGTGSGSGYVLTVFVLFYAPSVLVWAWFTLTGPPPGHPLLAGPAAVTVLAAGLLMLGAGWSFLGPVPASAAWASWVLSTSVDRGLLLAGRAWTRVVLAVLPGAVLGAVAAVAAGLRDSPALAMLVIGGSGGVIVCGAAILGQRRDVRPAGWLRWGAVLVLLVAAVGLQLLSTRPLPSGWWWPAGVAMPLGAVVVAATAARSVRHIPLHRLTAADTVRVAMTMALAEQSLEWVVTADPGARRRARAAHRPLTGTGQSALAAVCRRLFWRNRIGLARFAATAAVPSLIVALGHGMPPAPVTVAVVSLLAATAAISSAADTARRFHHDPRLQAHFGIDTKASRRTMMTIPTAMTIVWTLLAAPALILGGPAAMVVIVPALAYTVVAYRLTRPEYVPSYTMGQQYQTDTVQYFLRGPAQLLIACGVAALLAR
jgi:uncharacterized membrane protein